MYEHIQLNPHPTANTGATVVIEVTEGKTSGPTHTYPFNGPFSGTTQVSHYQKGKTNLDFTEASDSECQWHQLGHMTEDYQSAQPNSFRVFTTQKTLTQQITGRHQPASTLLVGCQEQHQACKN